MLREFRDFIIKGNALQLAIGVILGIAFGALIVAFTEGVIMAFIAAIIGRPDFNALSVEVNGATIEYGRVLTALLNLALVGGVLFLLIKLVKRLGMRMPSEETDHDVLVQIRDELKNRRVVTAEASAARS